MTRGAAVIVEDQNARVLLLRRSPEMSWKPGRWNLPGGHVDPGERPADAAIREAYEEAGVRVASVRPVVRIHLAPFIVDFYYAESWTGRVRINDESTRYAWIPREVAWQQDLLQTHRDALRWFVTHWPR